MYAQLKRTAANPPTLEIAPIVENVESSFKTDELETQQMEITKSKKTEPDLTSSLQVTDHDIRDYACSIGINPETEPELMKFAEQGFMQPLDPAWRAIPTDADDCYFVNRFTGQTSKDHPMDNYFRTLIKEHRIVKNKIQKSTTDSPLSPASDDHAVLSDALSWENELLTDSVTFGSPESYKSGSALSDKKVTFSNILAEIREFDPFHGFQSPYQSDMFNPTPDKQSLRPATPGFMVTEPCYRLIQIQ